MACVEEEPEKEPEPAGADMIAVKDPEAMEAGDDESAREDIALTLPERLPVAFCNTSESAAASRLDFATPAPGPAPLELESFEPQQTTSTIGGQAVAAAKMLSRCQELQLEKIRLERVRIGIEIVNKQLQLKESDDSNLSKGQSAAGRSKQVSSPILASTMNLHNCCDYCTVTCSGFRLEEDVLRPCSVRAVYFELILFLPDLLSTAMFPFQADRLLKYK